MSEREQEIRDRLDAAVEPWRFEELLRGTGPDLSGLCDGKPVVWETFLTHAPYDVAYLVAEIARLRAERDMLRVTLKDTTQDRDAYSISLEVADGDLSAARQQIADLREQIAEAVTHADLSRLTEKEPR